MGNYKNCCNGLGGVIFIDLRDREGIVQVVFNPEINKAAWEIADKCRSEYVIEVTGVVRRRGENAVNPKMDEFETIYENMDEPGEITDNNGVLTFNFSD